MYTIELYSTQSNNCPLEKYLGKIASQHKDEEILKIKSMLDLLEEHGLGLMNIYPNSIKYIQEQIYELRPSKTRILFFCIKDNKIILLNGFEKKTQKTPDKEKKLAIKYKNDYIKRYGK